MYKPSIWDSELDFGRRQYIETILRHQSEPMKLRDLAKMISVISREPEHAEKIDKTEVFHDSQYRRILTRDIHKINYSPVFHFIITHDRNGVKIGTKTDAREFVENAYREGLKKIVLAQRMAKKLSLDGQITLNKEIINAYERGEDFA